jgi:hypothetical protein
MSESCEGREGNGFVLPKLTCAPTIACSLKYRRLSNAYIGNLNGAQANEQEEAEAAIEQLVVEGAESEDSAGGHNIL